MNTNTKIHTKQPKQQKQGNKKLPAAVLTGALVGGAFVMLKDPDQRKRVKEGTKSTKDTITSYTSRVKEDPSGKKNDLIERIRKTASITNEAITKIQDILDNQGKEITEKAQDVKEESKEIVSTAKDAGEELQEAGEKAKQAKEELTTSSDKEEQNNPVTKTNAQPPQ